MTSKENPKYSLVIHGIKLNIFRWCQSLKNISRFFFIFRCAYSVRIVVLNVSITMFHSYLDVFCPSTICVSEVWALWIIHFINTAHSNSSSLFWSLCSCKCLHLCGCVVFSWITWLPGLITLACITMEPLHHLSTHCSANKHNRHTKAYSSHAARKRLIAAFILSHSSHSCSRISIE